MNHMVITSYVSLIGKKRKSLSSVVDSSNQRLHSSSWGAVTDAAEPISLFKGFPLQRRKERWWDLWALRRHAKVSGTTPQQLVVFPCPLGSGLPIQRLHAVCRPAMQCCSSYIQWLKKKNPPRRRDLLQWLRLTDTIMYSALLRAIVLTLSASIHFLNSGHCPRISHYSHSPALQIAPHSLFPLLCYLCSCLWPTFEHTDTCYLSLSCFMLGGVTYSDPVSSPPVPAISVVLRS